MKRLSLFLTALVLIFASFSGCSSETTEKTLSETDVSDSSQTSVFVSEDPEETEEAAEEAPAEPETESPTPFRDAAEKVDLQWITITASCEEYDSNFQCPRL